VNTLPQVLHENCGTLEGVCNPEKSDQRTASVPHCGAIEKKIQYQKHNYGFEGEISQYFQLKGNHQF
jgi:hypothetical protein